ncbi:hypothetical protein N7447_004268 [Penicillium robsamsonii]|uniref:uncharacterized protein n=1 Tax=Penicillium robsamsonii TaxID=1792511 RepID=UPI0025479E18|nr:uncharacterized protein N7447_004268 [Penicillium robsamsonii]KAJ5827505.1 hypothetical protein N7447_004268 [Penicillium robsamsonii]
MTGVVIYQMRDAGERRLISIPSVSAKHASAFFSSCIPFVELLICKDIQSQTLYYTDQGLLPRTKSKSKPKPKPMLFLSPLLTALPPLVPPLFSGLCGFASEDNCDKDLRPNTKVQDQLGTGIECLIRAWFFSCSSLVFHWLILIFFRITSATFFFSLSVFHRSHSPLELFGHFALVPLDWLTHLWSRSAQFSHRLIPG